MLAGLVFTSAALAASNPRFYSATPKPTVVRYQTAFDRQGPFSDAKCWLYDGNKKSGWRHIGCVGNYNYRGATYRFKLVATPRNCSQLHEVVTISGEGKETRNVVWPHLFFSCKR